MSETLLVISIQQFTCNSEKIQSAIRGTADKKDKRDVREDYILEEFQSWLTAPSIGGETA